MVGGPLFQICGSNFLFFPCVRQLSDVCHFHPFQLFCQELLFYCFGFSQILDPLFGPSSLCLLPTLFPPGPLSFRKIMRTCRTILRNQASCSFFGQVVFLPLHSHPGHHFRVLRLRFRRRPCERQHCCPLFHGCPRDFGRALDDQHGLAHSLPRMCKHTNNKKHICF